MRKPYIYIILASSGLIAATLGMVNNVAGIYFTPIAEDFGVGIGATSLTLTISNYMFAISGILVPRLLKTVSFRKILFIGTLGVVLGTAGLSVAASLPVLYLFNILRGFSCGLISLVQVTMLINYWFRSGVGLITSLVIGCSGITGAVFSPVMTSIIQMSGWRTSYLLGAVIMAVMLLPVLLLPIRLTPEEMDMEPYGKGAETATESAEPSSLTAHISPLLFLLVLISGVAASFVTSFPPHLPSLAEASAFSAGVGSAMLSVCMIINTAGKVVLGVLSDVFGSKRAILLFGILVISGICLLLFVPQPTISIVAAALLGFSFSLPTVGIVLMIRGLFGTENYGSVYPKISMAITITSASGYFIIGLLYDLSGSYRLNLWLMLGLLVLMTLMVFQAYRSGTK